MTLKEHIEKYGDIPLTKPKGVSQDQWKRALDLYQVAKNKGDRYPELTVAQAALETAWFKKPAGQYNYFGQKASKNQRGTSVSTREKPLLELNLELEKIPFINSYFTLLINEKSVLLSFIIYRF